MDQRRVEIHQKLVKTKAFASFAEFAISKGASCNMAIYDDSLSMKKKDKVVIELNQACAIN